MNILVVTHYYPRHGGGVEVIAWEVIRRLLAHGARVTWAASKPPDPFCLPGLSLLPMRCANIIERRTGIPCPLWSPRSLLALCAAIRRCDVVHLHDSLYMGNAAAYLFARLLGKPLVITQHIGDVPYSHAVPRHLLRFANATLARSMLGGSSRTVFYSDKVKRYFSGRVRFRNAPDEIANGVDTRLFRPISAKARAELRRRLNLPVARPMLLFVGRFVEKKGLHVIRTLASRFRECSWLLAGAGPIRPAEWKLPHVREVGWIDHDHLPPYYQAADLLVLPSIGEGFPLVVQEAMACGTPALMSDDTAAGWRGIEKLAIVCPPQANRMAALLDKLLNDRSALDERRAKVALYAANQWDWDVCARRYLELFDRLAPAGARLATMWDTRVRSG